MKYILFFWLLSVSSFTYSAEVLGKVCFGKNLGKASSEYSDLLRIQIGQSEKISFNQKLKKPFLALSGLDLNKTHMVKVYFDDKVGMSWPLNFNKLNTATVLIWRAAGSWRMEVVGDETC